MLGFLSGLWWGVVDKTSPLEECRIVWRVRCLQRHYLLLFLLDHPGEYHRDFMGHDTKRATEAIQAPDAVPL